MIIFFSQPADERPYWIYFYSCEGLGGVFVGWIHSLYNSSCSSIKIIPLILIP